MQNINSKFFFILIINIIHYLTRIEIMTADHSSLFILKKFQKKMYIYEHVSRKIIISKKLIYDIMSFSIKNNNIILMYNYFLNLNIKFFVRT